jgi:hypothetical protein
MPFSISPGMANPAFDYPLISILILSDNFFSKPALFVVLEDKEEDLSASRTKVDS